MHRRTRLCTTALTGLLLTLAPVYLMASQIFLTPLPLDEVVGQSALIVVAHRAEPHTVEVKIPVEGTPKIPPFTRYDERWVVDEIVHHTTKLIPAPAPQVGEAIQVAPAEWSDMMAGHVEYERHGIMESPALLSHTPSGAIPREPGAKVILMLSPEKSQGKLSWRYTLTGAQEPLSGRPAIEAALKTGPTSTITPAPTPKGASK
ncbi:MAG: hypothetical protein ACE366_25895 [Bradymonadia bacterium]